MALIFVALAAAGFVLPLQPMARPLGLIGIIPVQHEGRLKPLDAFARETLRAVSGKESWNKKSALEFFLGFAAQPASIPSFEIIRVDYDGLKDYLGLTRERKYFSLKELKPSVQNVIALARSAQEKRDKDQKPAFLEQKAEMLYTRMVTLEQIYQGESVKLIPVAGKDSWESPYLYKGPLTDEFMSMVGVFNSGDKNLASQQARQWVEKVAALSQSVRPDFLKMEFYYHQLRPFLKAWILYLLAFICLSFMGRRDMGLVLASLGLLFHSAGLILRSIILLRPPVSNMYETMVFMNWIIMVCAFIFFMLRRKDFFLSTAAVVSALVMIYADLLPIDRSLDVLVPVLRSNYWLTIHVLTIMTSYGFFGLAMALGHRHLFLEAKGKFSNEARTASDYTMVRLLQIGIITLGIGTVLGGVWANESWGRFWGWDPKETWALITFLGYMAIMHLRYAGKLGPFGMAVSTIIGFLLVLMTWYGVNFILGRGLHSYGSGSGGIVWIVYYLVFEALFVLFVIFKKLKLFRFI